MSSGRGTVEKRLSQRELTFQTTEQHYYLKTFTGRYKKTKWTKFAVLNLHKDLERAERERKKLQKLLAELEAQEKEDKRQIEEKEEQRKQVERELESMVERCANLPKRVKVFAKDRPSEGDGSTVLVAQAEEAEGEKQKEKVCATWKEFVEHCSVVLKMEAGDKVVYGSNGEEVRDLQSLKPGDSVHIASI
ncbi:hypothetical protein QOT17_013470 [Balamuthia mandrillaris]